MNGRPAGVDAKVIRMDGIFDVPAAQRLARELADAGGGEIRIDLTHVREFHDFGVALLARELAGRQHTSIAGLHEGWAILRRFLTSL